MFTDDGLLIENESRINRAIFEDTHGIFEFMFDNPLTWKELDESGIRKHLFFK